MNRRRASATLLKTATAASTTLFILTLVLWTSSYAIYWVVGRAAYSGIGTELLSAPGRLVFYRYNNYGPQDPPPQEWSATAGPAWSRMGRQLRNEFGFSAMRHWWNRAGFRAVSRDRDQYFPAITIVACPYWFLALVTLPLTVRAFAQWRTSRRTRHRRGSNLCPRCGYDLRATPARCPECGTAPAGAHAEAPTTLPPT